MEEEAYPDLRTQPGLTEAGSAGGAPASLPAPSSASMLSTQGVQE